MIEMPFQERYPEYTSLPFGWYAVAYGDTLSAGEVRRI